MSFILEEDKEKIKDRIIRNIWKLFETEENKGTKKGIRDKGRTKWKIN